MKLSKYIECSSSQKSTQQKSTQSIQNKKQKDSDRVKIEINDVYYTVSDRYTEHKMPIIHVHGRDKNRNKHHIEIDGFRPYFFIEESEFTGDKRNSLEKDNRILNIQHGYESIEGEPLAKVECELPYHVPKIKDIFNKTYEGDIQFYNRFLISNEIKKCLSVPKHYLVDESNEKISIDEIEAVDEKDWIDVDPKICILDLEVLTDGEGVPQYKSADKKVTAISLYNNYSQTVDSWVLVSERWGISLQELKKNTQNTRFFHNEKELLRDFNKYVSKQNFDLVSGWNSDGFDLPYLINRSLNLNIDSIRSWTRSDLEYITDDNIQNNIQYKLRDTKPFDMLKAYKKTQVHDLKSYSLEYVAKKEDVSEKLEHELSLDELYRQKPQEFIEYNRRDVIAVKEIEESVGIIDLFDNLRSVTGVLIEDSFYNKDLIDLYTLRKAYQKEIILPSRSKPDRSWYYGAYVFDPQGGKHENVVYPDLASLYPYTMWSLNMSPETAIGTKEDLKESEYTKQDCVWGYVDTRPIKFIEKGDTRDPYKNGEYKAIIQKKPDGSRKTVWSDTPQYEKFYYLKQEEKEGFITSILDELIDFKYEYKGTGMYPAVKRVLNCFTPDTDVLTPNGVKNITELEVGDEVYSFNKETNQVEIKPVVDTYNYPNYSGELIDIKTNSIDFRVTPNHRMLVEQNNPSTPRKNRYEFKEAQELEENPYTNYELPNQWNIKHGERIEEINLLDYYSGEYEIFIDLKNNINGHIFKSNIDIEDKNSIRRRKLDQYDITSGYIITKKDYENNKEYINSVSDKILIHKAKNHKWIPLKYNGDDFIELLSWYITEGNVYRSESKKYQNGNYITQTTQINISQKRDVSTKEYNNILSLFSGMDLYTSKETEKCISITSEILGDVLEDLCGSGSYNKKIPDLIFNTSKQQKKLFFNRMIDGDGNNRRDRYSTASEQLRDDFLRLCLHIGIQPKYTRYSGAWRIQISKNRNKNTLRMNRSSDRSKAENGVYCVTVKDNNSLLAGRNGKFQFVGQSYYGVFGYSTQYNSFRLFDWKLAETVTLSGRKVIQNTASKFIDELEKDGYEAELIGGDTDSCQTSIKDTDMETAVKISEEKLQYINDIWYDEFAKEEFGMDRHKFEVELEKYSRSFFMLGGTKKRYAEWVWWDEDDGNLKERNEDYISITGLEATRSDTANITQKAQKKVLEMILKNDLDTAKEKVYSYLEDLENGIRSGDIPLSDVGQRSGIGQPLSKYGSKDRTPQPIYRGAKYVNEFINNESIGEGDKPYKFYVEGINERYSLPKTYSSDTAEDGKPLDAVAVSDIENMKYFKVNFDKMIDKILKSPIEPILHQLSWNYGNAVNGVEQISMSDFL